MKTGISFTVTPEDRLRLEAIVRDRNAKQKHVKRAKTILATAVGWGTNEDYAPRGVVEAGCLALAGTVHARRRAWFAARQDPQAGQEASAGGDG